MKKKVLFLIHTLGGGGAEKVLVNLVNNMDYEKFEVTLMTIINTGIFRQELSSKINYKTMFNIPFKKDNNQQSGSLLNKTSKMKKIFASIYSLLWKILPTKIIYKWKIKDKYDIEVAFLEGITAKVISVSTNKNSKKYAWIHVDLINEIKSEKFFISRKSEKKCYSKFDKIVAVSEIVKQQFIKKFSYDESKVIVKYNAIDSDDIIKKSKEKIDDLVIPQKFKIISVGRLSTQKGYDRLLEIANRLKKDNFDFILWIIGVGPEQANLEKYIRDNHLENDIILLGFKKNPYKYLKNADLFVCSSRAEGFSTVVSEAIVLDIPIVTTECSGMKEMLGENNEYGIITKNNSESLYIGIKSILSDKNLYEHYKLMIKKRKKFFQLTRTVMEVEKLLGD